MHRRIATVLLLGALAFSPGSALAEDSAALLEELVVELAHTPAHHAAIARHYRAKAAEARSEAARHESMGRSYGRGKLGTRGASVHCKKLSEENSALAAEYEELARLHEAEAQAKP